MCLSHTALLSSSVQLKLENALRFTALNGWSVCHIANKAGNAFLAVRYRPSHKRPGRPFIFLDRKGHDVSESVYKALRMSV